MALARPKTRGSNRMASLTGISIAGYKSLVDDCRLDIRPLTILAGANSAGKSSAIQPLLLMKQTLEAAYDPGPLLLDGPNLRFSSAEQLLSKTAGVEPVTQFSVKLELGPASAQTLEVVFGVGTKGQRIQVLEMTHTIGAATKRLRPDMTSHEVFATIFGEPGEALRQEATSKSIDWFVERLRCFLTLRLVARDGTFRPNIYSPAEAFDEQLRGLIHVPGLRGNPEREYPTTAVGGDYPGTFNPYVASIVSRWQEEGDDRVAELGADLAALGLTWKVQAKAVNDTKVELRVGRLPHGRRGGARDLVNIADVGFGVSQSLPVVVALLTARPGQVVYLEQPEIHLHPRAQVAMAGLLAKAAKRGVCVIAETHSALLLLAVQTLVIGDAPGLDPGLVKLHWFERDANGATRVTKAELDQSGAFGDWPQDFDDVTLTAQSEYLDAAEAALLVRGRAR